VGSPICAIQWRMRARAQVMVDVSVNGIASGHLLKTIYHSEQVSMTFP